MLFQYVTLCWSLRWIIVNERRLFWKIEGRWVTFTDWPTQKHIRLAECSNIFQLHLKSLIDTNELNCNVLLPSVGNISYKCILIIEYFIIHPLSKPTYVTTSFSFFVSIFCSPMTIIHSFVILPWSTSFSYPLDCVLRKMNP